jgi:chemotaxis-related protein WspB
VLEDRKMLFLTFQIGDEGYALSADHIVEILPLLDMKKIRGAAHEVAGLIRYRGRFVPVVDLAALETGQPATARMGTRIILVDLAVGAGRELIGLIAESVTETIRCEPEDFAPFATGPRGLLQRLDLDGLLPPTLVADLFLAREAAA